MPRPPLVALLLALLVALPAWAESSRDLGYAQQAQIIEGRKVALVIGNGRYQSAGRLQQAPVDARVMAAALRDAGFDVALYENLSRTRLSSVIVDFEGRLRNAEVGFFYYAGHAIQLGDRNYLVPIDADIPSERYVPTYAVGVDEVMRSMEEAQSRLNLLVLDACRNNPFAPRWTTTSRSTGASRGLATINAPSGFIVAYATGPGDVAADDGTYAAALSNHLRVPGREISEVFRYVHQQVKDASGSGQLPWVSEARGPGSFYPGGAPAGLDAGPVSTPLVEPVVEAPRATPAPSSFQLPSPKVPKSKLDKGTRSSFDGIWQLERPSERQQALLSLAQDTADQTSSDGEPLVDAKALTRYRRLLRDESLSTPYTDLFLQASGWGGQSDDWGFITEVGLALGFPMGASPITSRRDRSLGAWASLGLGKEHTTYKSDSAGTFLYYTDHELDSWGNLSVGALQSFGVLSARGMSVGLVLGEGVAASLGSKGSCATECSSGREDSFSADLAADLQLMLRVQHRTARFLDVGLRYRPMMGPLLRPSYYEGAERLPGLVVRLGAP
jgi:hypothetical protein